MQNKGYKNMDYYWIFPAYCINFSSLCKTVEKVKVNKNPMQTNYHGEGQEMKGHRREFTLH